MVQIIEVPRALPTKQVKEMAVITAKPARKYVGGDT
jgi:hypothetical protein